MGTRTHSESGHAITVTVVRNSPRQPVNKKNLFIYTFITICLTMTGLSLWTSQSSRDLVEMSEQYNEIKEELNHFKSFDDSLAGNPRFRQRLLDKVTTATELMEVKQKQGDELRRKIEEFEKLYPDRQGMISNFKILESARTFVSIIFVIMAIPFFIHVFKRR